MSRRKEISSLLSSEEASQVQHLLAHYNQLADSLHKSTTQAEAEAGLASLFALSEDAQNALLKDLAKVHTADAADILLAVNTLSPLKEVRKEARRSLLKLEAVKVYPQWTPSLTRTPAVQANIANAPRFWKGVVTETREQGEVELILCWEQGYDYGEVRMLAFLLDFWRNGVKDVHFETTSKRRVDERINELRSSLVDAQVVDCALAEGKRLIEEALSVTTWHATQPSESYRNHLPFIKSMILDATDEGEDRGQSFINPNLEDQEVAIHFIGAWSLGDYGLAYDLLTRESSFREGLTREDWVALRRAWADEAHPARLELGFVHEREQVQSSLWVPTSVSRTSTRKEVEIGWSLELAETPLSGTLKEMPMGTAVNKETRRHWFWTSYTLVHVATAWRIQSVTDEGAKVQGQQVNDLQQQIDEQKQAIEAFTKQPPNDLQEAASELAWRLTQLLHYYDALIARLPLDRSVCDEAYTWSVNAGNPERAIVYLERMAQRFPERRSETLRNLGATEVGLAFSETFSARQQSAEALLDKAEAHLREAIALDDNALSRLLLAETLMSRQRNDEAEAELQKAQTMSTTQQEAAALEAALGNIAMRRERVAEALPHFQRVATINANYPGIWFNIGFAQRLLGQMAEAEKTYLHAINVDPDDIRAYSELIAIYMNKPDQQRAREIAEQGVRANPGSAHLHALLASVLFEMGNQRAAQREIEEAESLDPQLEIVQSVRQYISAHKKR